MARTVSDVFIETLVAAGVKRIYGVVGDSLNGIDRGHPQKRGNRVAARAPRRGRRLCRRRGGPSHRRARRLRRQLRAGQHASHQWAVRLPSQPRAGAGHRRADSQRRDRQRLFSGDAVPSICSRIAATTASWSRSPSRCRACWRSPCAAAFASEAWRSSYLPGDVAHARDARAGDRAGHRRLRPIGRARASETLAKRPSCSTPRKKVTILGGAGCAGAHAELIALAGNLQAPDRPRPARQGDIEYDNPYDVGMTGLLGFSSGYYAMMDAMRC